MTGSLFAFAGLAAMLVILWLANGIRQIGAISRGKQIGNRSRSALLLIDLQSVFWDHGPYDETAKSNARSAILSEIAAARAEGMPVVAVRQVWSIPSTKIIARLAMKGQALEGTPGTEIAQAFDGLFDHILVKRVQDAFETGALDTLLDTLDVGKLRIAGLDMSYCVAKTALAACQRGYEVEIVTGATLSADETAGAKTRTMLAEKGIRLR